MMTPLKHPFPHVVKKHTTGSGGVIGRDFTHWGHGRTAGVGAVVVGRHHVGKIVGR